ncbi:hypothetical protein [Planotetraspora mira]|uniref:Uncharacterized protein n=1 Tax=Planotetraspora mira TaxID=58121 RepID=A0A8J3X3W1_9ACTN|nr:hypothetical protein [Planotetraspora mira]GII26992.1 hypothetical protein Pmi06nite_04340 [Planotetraspora mira]
MTYLVGLEDGIDIHVGASFPDQHSTMVRVGGTIVRFLGPTLGATGTDNAESSRTGLNSRGVDDQHRELIWTRSEIVWEPCK